MKFDSFFRPDSVALIGASRFEGKVGNSIAKNLLKFKKVYFVNPAAKRILGRRSYASVLEIEQPVDLAVIAVKSDIVPNVLIECGEKAIRAAIIITAGFSEIGKLEAEQRLLEIAKRYNIRLLGPNCLGNINPYAALNTTFTSIPVQKGALAFVSQSGALCSAALDFALQKQIGFSGFASLGNMADVDFADLVTYFDADPKTTAIILYIETLKNGAKFMQAARRCRKPIIAIKAGISEAGAKAALTHTGSLAGSYAVYRAAFKQSDVIEANSLTNAFDIARFSSMKKRKIKKILIVSNAGGPAVLAADYSESAGLNLAKLPKAMIAALNRVLPATWSKNNPIDIVGDADAQRYKKVFDVLKSKEGRKGKNFYDCLICILTPQEMSQPFETAKALKHFAHFAKSNKVIACFLGGERIAKAKAFLIRNRISCFSELRRAFDVLAALRSTH